MDAEKVAFWGIVLKPGEPADLDLDDGETLRVTTASYGEELNDASGRSVVTAAIRPDDDSPPRKFAVAVLKAGKAETVTMDVAFVGEENVSFEVSGKNPVHLVGNFSFENDFDEDSDEEGADNHLIGLYDDTISSGSEEDDKEAKVKTSLQKDKPIITELPDEDAEDDEKEDNEGEEEDKKEEKPVEIKKSPVASKKKGKKGKMANGNSAGPTKKVANASAEPILKSEEKNTDNTEKLPQISAQKKNVKGKKKKSGLKKEVTDGAQQTGGAPDAKGDTDMKEMHQGGKASARQTAKAATDKVEIPAKGEDVDVEISPKSGEEEEVKPSSKKDKKRRRKHNVTVNVPEQAPTPPSAKKTKVSERVATPAPSKVSRHAAPSKTSLKANGSAEVNGTPGAEEGEANTPSTDAQSSKKRRRARKRRAA